MCREAREDKCHHWVTSCSACKMGVKRAASFPFKACGVEMRNGPESPAFPSYLWILLRNGAQVESISLSLSLSFSHAHIHSHNYTPSVWVTWLFSMWRCIEVHEVILVIVGMVGELLAAEGWHAPPVTHAQRLLRTSVGRDGAVFVFESWRVFTMYAWALWRRPVVLFGSTG